MIIDTICRNGDLTIIPITEAQFKQLKLKQAKDNILALGEVTGHRHLAVVDRPATVTVWEFLANSAVKVVETETPFTITHEEHKTLTVPYKHSVVFPRREMDWFVNTVRSVKD